jgi:eukaryotic-like serine/threonine-protein kinase
MRKGIIWCGHCGQAHLLSELVCPNTGKTVERSMHRATAEHEPLIGAIIADKYRVLRMIGSGGTSVVLEAENLSLQRLVAIKVVQTMASPQVLERLSREARIVASLQHANICDIYDFGDIPGRGPYLVTERLFGETVATLRVRVSEVPLRHAIEIVAQVLSGLHAAHSRNIVHRDIKPKNIFLVDRLGCPPLAKILDFGFAKDLGASRSITMPGVAVGTLPYMSPEQISGERLDARSDLFSTAVLAYELISGVHPFWAATAREIGARILRDVPAPIGTVRLGLPAALNAVFNRALEKSPEARFPDAGSFQQELIRAAGAAYFEYDEGTPASSVPSTAHVRRPGA